MAFTRRGGCGNSEEISCSIFGFCCALCIQSPVHREKPIRDVLQRWRRSLASLLFFIILLTENFGLSSSIVDHSLQIPNSTARILRDYWGITNFPIFSRTPLIDQCLVMNRNLSKKMCAMKPKLRQKEIRNTHLSFCNFYNVYNIIEFMDSSKGNDSSDKCITGTAQSCQNCLEEIEDLDNALYAMFCAFEEVLSRYDCEHQFSAHFNCNDCKNAYKDWLCASNIKLYDRKLGEVWRPCPSYCTAVEQRCPYFLPDFDEQYAGESTFICSKHTHIKTTADGSPQRCYRPCHILDDHKIHSSSEPCLDTVDSEDDTNSTSSQTGGVYSINGHTHKHVYFLVLLWLFRTYIQYTTIGLT